ncbi:MAG: creatininase family protein [Candidatus Wallbacteria bacterium]|nr:creatininase family protein [Candidatus Wallbacteria bacterium]
MPIHRLEELTWRQLDQLPRDRTAILLPISPLEEHGTHLPVGMDGFTAVALAETCADEFVTRDPGRHAVLAPLVPLGTWTFDMVGSVKVRQRVVRELASDLGESFARYGFRHIVVTNGHGAPGHIVALEEACDRITRRYRSKGVQMVSPFGPMVSRYFEGQYGAELAAETQGELSAEQAAHLPDDIHAGMFETSLLLHLKPHLVGPEYRTLPPVLMPKESLGLTSAQVAGQGLGYLGYPASARASFGEAAVRLVRRELGELLDRMVAGEDVSALVHSSYGRIPYFRTDFLRVLLGAALALVLAIWLFWR